MKVKVDVEENNDVKRVVEWNKKYIQRLRQNYIQYCRALINTL